MGMMVEGFDRFVASLDKLAALPSSEFGKMLTAGGEEVKKGHQEKLDQYKAVDTGKLRDTIKVGKPNTSAGYVEIRPTGTRKRGNTVTRNEEIGYITEYGKLGEPARPWMREGNADSEDKAVDAAQNVFNNYLDKIGL